MLQHLRSLVTSPAFAPALVLAKPLPRGGYTRIDDRRRCVYTRGTPHQHESLRARARARNEALSGERPSTFVGPPTKEHRGLREAGRIRDVVLITVAGVLVLFTGGAVYMSWYKENVIRKIERAFVERHDPALDLTKSLTDEVAGTGNKPYSAHENTWAQVLRRPEQDLVDRIIQGFETGRYFILLGPKASDPSITMYWTGGTGKTTMILDAMKVVQSEGVVVCDVHRDLEVFRLRFGEAINFEYNEDSQMGLFQRREPREGGPLLDIERALAKLNDAALRRAKRTKRPLVLVLTNIHQLYHNEDGRSLLLQLQQRAEAWAASGILVTVFSSDDFWPFLVMRNSASRMTVLSIFDLNTQDARKVGRRIRSIARREGAPPEVLNEVVRILGGRLTYLDWTMKAPDMLSHARHALAVEKAWLLGQTGLIPGFDGSVVEEQKWSSCTWLLLREFVRRHAREIDQVQEAIARGEATSEDLDNIPLPRISYYECRQIMTRPDFIEELDRKNIIAIDVNFDITPDSWLILRAAEEVVWQDDFEDLLRDVRSTVSKAESLQRTRELVFKDIGSEGTVRLAVDKGGPRF
ncbi:hypothetical protein C8Q77DRAFT_1050755 [Trametes polyzona]|nr:hypothetical protein C8Q77DRAFT_1050755 [Trametes polyzona]